MAFRTRILFVISLVCASCSLKNDGGSEHFLDIPTEKVISKIGFGSCSHQERPQPIWKIASEQNLDLFVFAGDMIYSGTNPEKMKRDYQKFLLIPEFADFRKQVPIIATWDDNDYGQNDGGKNYSLKSDSQKIFLDFLEEPKNSKRRKTDGVYTSYLFGPSEKKLQIILLDTRFFRDDLYISHSLPYPGQFTANPDSTTSILGPEQWTWLLEELQKPAELRIIVSSIQVIPTEHGWEKWANFPHERSRLLSLLSQPEVGPVLLLSGDRHKASLYRYALDGKEIIEATSSSLSNPLPKAFQKEEIDYFRLDDEIFSENFGTLHIDWTSQTVEISIIDLQGQTTLRHRIAF